MRDFDNNGDLAAEITTRRVTGIETMSVLSGALSQLLDNSSHLSACLATLVGGVKGTESSVSINQLGARVEVIRDTLQSWNSRLAQDATAREFQKIHFALADLRKIVLKFHMIALQAHIQIVADKGAGNDSFIQELRAVPVEISVCLGALGESAQRVENDHLIAKAQCHSALQAVHSIDRIFVQAIGDIEKQQLAAGAAKAQIAGLSEQLQTDTRHHSNSIISSFQFSDFFAQRMDHIAWLLAQKPPLAQPCAVLAGVQLLALVRDGRDIMSQLDQAVFQLSRMRGNFLDAYSSTEAAVRLVIEGQKSALEAALRQRDQAVAAIEMAISATKNIGDGVAEAQTKFAQLNRLSGVIDMAAINARLRSERLHTAQKPMAVLSAAVLQTAEESRSLMDECRAALDNVVRAQDTDLAQQLGQHVQSFWQAYADCEGGLINAQTQLDQLTRLRGEVMTSLERLDQCLSDAKGVTDKISAFLMQLEQLTQHCPVPSGQMIWPDLSAVYDIYTMDSERQVHRQLLGLPEPAAPPPATAEDLDSVFF